MTIKNLEGLTALRPLLYGENATFPELLRKDVPAVIGRVYRRKSPSSGFTHEFVKTSDIERALEKRRVS